MLDSMHDSVRPVLFCIGYHTMRLNFGEIVYVLVVDAPYLTFVFVAAVVVVVVTIGVVDDSQLRRI